LQNTNVTVVEGDAAGEILDENHSSRIECETLVRR
jgi:hypothetical protein